jgi:hypothetical protein
MKKAYKLLLWIGIAIVAIPVVAVAVFTLLLVFPMHHTTFVSSEGVVLDEQEKGIPEVSINVEYKCRVSSLADGHDTILKSISLQTDAKGEFSIPSFDVGWHSSSYAIPGSCRVQFKANKEGYCDIKNLDECSAYYAFWIRDGHIKTRAGSRFESYGSMRANESTSLIVNLSRVPEYDTVNKILNDSFPINTIAIYPTKKATWAKGGMGNFLMTNTIDLGLYFLDPESETVQRGGCTTLLGGSNPKVIQEKLLWNEVQLLPAWTYDPVMLEKAKACFIPGTYRLRMAREVSNGVYEDIYIFPTPIEIVESKAAAQ